VRSPVPGSSIGRSRRHRRHRDRRGLPRPAPPGARSRLSPIPLGPPRPSARRRRTRWRSGRAWPRTWRRCTTRANAAS